MSSYLYHKVNISGSIDSLQKKGKITAASAKWLRQDANRTIKVPSVDNDYYDPAYACFLIDASGSMDAYRQAVIDSHPMMLDDLRRSAKCIRNALIVGQYIFNSQTQMLHPFVKLGANPGSDGVVVLNDGNYKPDGMTALYKTVYVLLQDLAAVMDYCEAENVIPKFTIGLITDGDDTEKGVNPEDIRRFLDELRQMGYLQSSVVIGFSKYKFVDYVESIKCGLGFDNAIEFTVDGRNIRRAFLHASKSCKVAHARS